MCMTQANNQKDKTNDKNKIYQKLYEPRHKVVRI